MTDDKAIYSASAVERATVVFFLLSQLIAPVGITKVEWNDEYPSHWTSQHQSNPLMVFNLPCAVTRYPEYI